MSASASDSDESISARIRKGVRPVKREDALEIINNPKSRVGDDEKSLDSNNTRFGTQVYSKDNTSLERAQAATEASSDGPSLSGRSMFIGDNAQGSKSVGTGQFNQSHDGIEMDK